MIVMHKPLDADCALVQLLKFIERFRPHDQMPALGIAQVRAQKLTLRGRCVQHIARQPQMRQLHRFARLVDGNERKDSVCCAAADL